jgi:hypothetical protein
VIKITEYLIKNKHYVKGCDYRVGFGYTHWGWRQAKLGGIYPWGKRRQRDEII